MHLLIVREAYIMLHVKRECYISIKTVISLSEMLCTFRLNYAAYYFSRWLYILIDQVKSYALPIKHTSSGNDAARIFTFSKHSAFSMTAE